MTDQILVVDHDPIVAETLCILFQNEGFRASAAYSVEEGLRMARKLRPQLVLCDVILTENGEMELVDDLAREMPECRVIVQTAHFSNVVKAGQDRKMPQRISVVQKPCPPEQLLRAAGAMLRRV